MLTNNLFTVIITEYNSRNINSVRKWGSNFPNKYSFLIILEGAKNQAYACLGDSLFAVLSALNGLYFRYL